MADSPRILELKRRVQSDPASIAFAALAEEYRRAGRFEEAVAACVTGLNRHPSYLSARVTLGRSLLEVGRYDEAQTELEHVLRLAPENLAAIRGLADIQHRRTGAGHPVAQAPPMPPAAAPVPVNVNGSAPAPSAIRLKPDTPYGQPRTAESSGPERVAVVTAACAQPTVVDDAPALAGLEEFLSAILRVRAERSTAR